VRAELGEEHSSVREVTGQPFLLREFQRLAGKCHSVIMPVTREGVRQIETKVTLPDHRVAVVQELDRCAQVALSVWIVARDEENTTCGAYPDLRRAIT
jgi:hypothetical protein